MGLSFTIAAGPRQRSHSHVHVCGTHDQSLLSHIQDFPNLEGQIPVFISPRNSVAQLYPQALGSFSVASYDSQGYGGGIRPRLHTGTWTVIPHDITAVTFLLQPGNGGIVMVNFYSGFVNCKSEAEATLEDVVGMCTEL
jgi:hypothetical protein